MLLSKAESSTIFWIFEMTLPVIEPRSSGPLANTQLIRSMSRLYKMNIFFNNVLLTNLFQLNFVF